MTTLMITPYAPYRDGIAIYAVQEVRALRREGVDVEVLSPLPSAAHHHLVIGSATGMFRLLRQANRYDKIIVQFYPELLFGACRNRVERLAVWHLLKRLAELVPVELRIHEIDYEAATVDKATMVASRSAILAASKVQVHTVAEAELLATRLDFNVALIELVEHGRNFERKTTLDKAAARRELGLDSDAHLFVSIGFVQSHKGFDRGVRAFARAGLAKKGAQYLVVGSVRVDHPDLLAYATSLAELCESTEGARFLRGFVGDEEFDLWLVAADTLVLPYREIWSSGVLERAALFGTPVITTDVGGLAEQVGAGSSVVKNDSELASAMGRAAGSEPDANNEQLLDRSGLVQLLRERVGESADVGLTPLERLGQIRLPEPNSARRGAAELKTVVQRLTAWQLEPVVVQLNRLQARTAEAFEELHSSRSEEA